MARRKTARGLFRAAAVRFARLLCGIDAFFAARKKGGEYASALREALDDLRNRQITRAERYAAYNSILRYLFGERIAYRLIGDKAVDLTSVCLDADKLYHFTPASKIREIRKRGIRPNHWYVFLTDDPEAYSDEYIAWKSYMRRRSEKYAVLCIDAKRLRSVQPLYRTTRPNEVVTRAVAPNYIVFIKTIKSKM